MKNIIARFNEIRKEEQGFTIPEVLTVISLLCVLTAMSIGIILSATQGAFGFINKNQGINQGAVVDFTKEAHTAAVKMRESHPDKPVNEQNVLANGNLTVPAGMEWTVNEYRGFGAHSKPIICVIAYSTTEQTSKFTFANPAEYNSVELHKAKESSGCYFNKKIENPDLTWTTEWVPNYYEEESFLSSPAPEPTTTTEPTTEPTTTDTTTTTGGA